MMQCTCAVLSPLACAAVLYFFPVSNKRYDFRRKKKVTERKICVLIFSTTFFFSETFLVLRRTERDVIMYV